MASLFASFGQGQNPVGTPGPTTGQLLGKQGLAGLLAGGPIQNSTSPFAQGGNTSPNNLQGGLNLGNGVKSLGINAKSPNQNITTPTNTIPNNQVSPNQTSGANNTVIGSFQGKPIYAGNQASINSQMADILNPSQAMGAQPTTPISSQAANTYNSGVNAYGNTLPGYTGPTTGPNALNSVPPVNPANQPGNQTMTPASIAAASGNTGTSAPGSYGTTVPTSLASLFSAANSEQGAIDSVTNQANRLLNGFTTTSGLPTNIALGEEGQVQANENSLIANLLSSQGQKIGAAQSALNAVAPITGVQYGTQTILPGQTTSGNTGSAGVSPSDPFYQTMQTYAQALVNNQGSAIPSSVTGNPALMAQLLQMAQQINPNFNYNTASGVGSAQQSNAATGGTAFTSANQGVYNTAISNLANYTNMAQNIASFGNMALNNIKSLPLTPSQAANMTIEQALQQFNSPQYAQFATNIQGLQARVSDLLSTGEIPSAGTAGAQSIINGTLNLGSLQATLNQVNDEANAIVQNQAGIASSAYQNIQSNSGTSGTANTSANGANPWH